MIACNHPAAYMCAMASITVRNVPEAVKEGLVRRAKATGESLEAFLRRVLEAEANSSDDTEELRREFGAILDRIDQLPPLPPGEKDAWELTEELGKLDSPALP